MKVILWNMGMVVIWRGQTVCPKIRFLEWKQQERENNPTSEEWVRKFGTFHCGWHYHGLSVLCCTIQLTSLCFYFFFKYKIEKTASTSAYCYETGFLNVHKGSECQYTRLACGKDYVCVKVNTSS